MGLKFKITVSSLLLLLASAVDVSGGTTLDLGKYGIKADAVSDISWALLKAWEEACSSSVASTILIPRGTYALGQIVLDGPCKAPINLVVKGTLRAPVEASRFKPRKGWISFRHIGNFSLSGGGVFNGEGRHSWGKHCPIHKYCGELPISVRFDYITNGMVKDITSIDSKQFHMNVLGCKNLTFQNVAIGAPDDSFNTDGIHIGRSSGINIIDSNIRTGDDCVSIGDDSQQIHIERVTCGPGHGIAIGSLGKYPNEGPVVGIRVKNCTFTNTDNGVRVKTWPALEPGSAADMHFEDIVMDNVSYPIIIDQEYCPHNRCNLKAGSSRVKISNVSFRNIRGTTSTQVAVKLICSQGLPCQNVELANINLKHDGKKGPTAISLCKNVKPNLFGVQLPTTCA